MVRPLLLDPQVVFREKVTMRKLSPAAIIILFILLPDPAFGQSPLLKRDVDWSSIGISSKKEIYSWERAAKGSRTVCFLALNGIEIVQGSVRINAPKAVVWFFESKSRRERKVSLHVYAESAEVDGQRLKQIKLVEGKRTREGSYLFMRLSSHFSLRWPRNVVKLDQRPRVPLLERADFVMQQMKEKKIGGDFFSDAPIENLPKGRWSYDIPSLMFNEFFKFNDPEDESKSIVVLLGDVRLVYLDTVLEADHAVVWVKKEDTKLLGLGRPAEVYAEGRVRLRKKTGTKGEPVPPGTVPGRAREKLGLIEKLEAITADRFFMKPSQYKAAFKDAEVRLNDKPGDVDLIASGKEVYQIDKHNTLVKDGYFTDCPYGKPHYRVRARKIRLIQKGGSIIASAWNITAMVGDTPVFYLPYLAGDIKQKSFLISGLEVGNSGRFGTFVRSDWNLKDLGIDPPWLKNFTLNADYFERRGPAVGLSSSYVHGTKNDGRQLGRLNAYYVHDDAEEDRNDTPIERADRGRFKWQHRWEISPEWRIDGEVAYISDSGFLSEYFEEEFEEGKEQETLVFARYKSGSVWGGLLAKKRINKFQTQVEELPSVALEVAGKPILGGAFQYSSSSSLGYYDLENGQMMAEPDPEALGRFHTSQKLAAPFRLWALHVNPSLGMLGTYATRSMEPDGSVADRSAHRVGIGTGIDLTMTMHRIYGVSSELLELERLRHVVQPEVRFDWLPYVSDGSENFVQMDNTDALDKMREFRAGIRQRFETKKKGTAVDYVTFDAFYVNTKTDSITEIETNGKQEFVELDLKWQFSDHIAFVSKDNRLALDDGTDHYNGGLYFDYSPGWQFFGGIRRITGESTSVTADIAIRLSRKYKLLIYEKYDFESREGDADKSLETRIALQRFWHKWILEFAGYRDAADDDTSFMIYVRHKSRAKFRQRP